MPQSNAMNLPIPDGMEFFVHNEGKSGVCDPLNEIAAVAWKWTIKKRKQYGNYWLVTSPDMNFWKPHLLHSFWRMMGAA